MVQCFPCEGKRGQALEERRDAIIRSLTGRPTEVQILLPANLSPTSAYPSTRPLGALVFEHT